MSLPRLAIVLFLLTSTPLLVCNRVAVLHIHLFAPFIHYYLLIQIPHSFQFPIQLSPVLVFCQQQPASTATQSPAPANRNHNIHKTKSLISKSISNTPQFFCNKQKNNNHAFFKDISFVGPRHDRNRIFCYQAFIRSQPFLWKGSSYRGTYGSHHQPRSSFRTRSRHSGW